MNWKKSIATARENYMMEKYSACRDHGVPSKRYSDKTANSLTACIIDFLKYSGHYANRISTTGMVRNINGQMKWTKGNTNKGTADISAIINGRAVSIEIKVGRDKMSEAQAHERDRIQSAGGVYVIARDMEGFFEWYNQFTATKKVPDLIPISTQSIDNHNIK